MKIKLVDKMELCKADAFCINHVYLNGEKCSVFISKKNKFTNQGKLFLFNKMKKECWEIKNLVKR